MAYERIEPTLNEATMSHVKPLMSDYQPASLPIPTSQPKWWKTLLMFCVSNVVTGGLMKAALAAQSYPMAIAVEIGSIFLVFLWAFNGMPDKFKVGTLGRVVSGISLVVNIGVLCQFIARVYG
jgi:hypothetical protein